MKKIISLFLSLLLIFSMGALTGCTDGDVEELKMYVPGEYMDEDIFEEFESWYTEQTGKKIRVVTPTTFDTVEDIMTAVEHDHADFDLLCPSDYAVERLISKDLLVKIDKDLIVEAVKNSAPEDEPDLYDDVEKFEDLINDNYVELARISDPDLEYSVPYMYGTFGLMYNYEMTGKHIDSWSAVFTDEYKSKSANKGSLREAMTSAAIWYKRDELNVFPNSSDAFHEKLQSIFDNFDDETLKGATSVLKEMTEYSALWGGEDLKFNMATETSNVEVALMWSCDAGYIMNEYEDDDGYEHEGNRDLWYVIPKEGGNIYLDNFVISKYAKNPTAAQYFLAFLCRKDIALLNSDYAGAVSPVKLAYDELYELKENQLWHPENLDEEDIIDFSDVDEDWKEMYFDMLFPSDETLMRCGTMRDYGDRDGKITKEWVYVYVR